MFLKRLLPVAAIAAGSLAVVIARPARAQTQTLLSLDAGPNTTVQTGQIVTVSIRLDNAPNVWVVNAEIDYDPALIYVIGTKVGSPVAEGTLFAPPEQTAIVRNNAQQPGRLIYTLSMLSPADPISGSGVVGTFKIFPLAAGKTRLTFSRGEVTSVTFTGSGDSRTSSQPQAVKFTPVLLELTITGDTVTPPPESTPTPLPSGPGGGSGPVNVPELQTTLFNVTAGPRGPETPTPAPVQGQGPSLPLVPLLVGIGVLVVIGIVLIARRVAAQMKQS